MEPLYDHQKEFSLEKRDEAHNDQNTLSANAWSGGLATIMTWWTRNSFTEGTQYEAKWWSHHNDLLNQKLYVGRSLESHHNDLVRKSSLWKNMMEPTMTKMNRNTLSANVCSGGLATIMTW